MVFFLICPEIKILSKIKMNFMAQNKIKDPPNRFTLIKQDLKNEFMSNGSLSVHGHRKREVINQAGELTKYEN